MNRFSRFLFASVLVLSLLAVYRLFSGPPLPRGAIVLTNLEAYELAQQSFQVSSHTTVLIDGVGSVDDRRRANGLAAYPWIVRISTGEVVWTMNESSGLVLNGSIATVTQDELLLEPGEYTLNFASYGQLLQRSRGSFRKDQNKWNVVVHSPDDNNVLRSIDGHIEDRGEDHIWDATSLGSDEKREYLFEIRSPVNLTIHAIGQLSDQDEVQPLDYSQIEDAITGQAIWQLTRDNTTWAGGVYENRIFRGQRSLLPGVYRAIATTNGTHHYDSWRGNPPYIPEGWGIRLSVSERESVRTFDPWMQQRNPLIGFTQVGDDEEYSQTFTVVDTTAVVVHALGELTGPDNGYDLARLDLNFPPLLIFRSRANLRKSRC